MSDPRLRSTSKGCGAKHVTVNNRSGDSLTHKRELWCKAVSAESLVISSSHAVLLYRLDFAAALICTTVASLEKNLHFKTWILKYFPQCVSEGQAHILRNQRAPIGPWYIPLCVGQCWHTNTGALTSNLHYQYLPILISKYEFMFMKEKKKAAKYVAY